VNIGIDIDNTITNTRDIILEYLHIFAAENNLPPQIDLGHYNLEKSLRWDTEQINLFLSTHLGDIYKYVIPKPHALEVIKDLHQDHSIILITSRNQRDKSIQAATLEWLTCQQLEYDKLVMNNTENMHHFSKLEACLDNHIDLMIEDHHELSLELSERIPVLMFDYPYNAHLEAHNIARVKDWLEVRRVIAGMGSKSPNW